MLIYLSMIDQKEDKIKFEELYIKYRQLMFYTANKILKDEYLSEDAVHMSFIKIIKHLDKINAINCPKTKGLIVIIVKRVAIDIYRKSKNENFISFDEYYSNSDLAIIEDKYSLEDSNLIKSISKLSENYKQVILLKYSHGFSNEEISRLLDISKDNVDKRIQRAKKKLNLLVNDMEVIESEEY